jgi:hypothetical protein
MPVVVGIIILVILALCALYTAQKIVRCFGPLIIGIIGFLAIIAAIAFLSGFIH